MGAAGLPATATIMATTIMATTTAIATAGRALTMRAKLLSMGRAILKDGRFRG